MTRAPIVAVALLLSACGGEPAAGPSPPTAPTAAVEPSSRTAPKGTVYGPGVTEGEVVTVPELLARVDELNGRVVRVEGTVTDVCAKRGCWIKVGAESEPRTVTFKVTDGVIVFPMSARGRHVVAEGTCEKRVLTLEKTRQLRAHEAEEAGEEFDPASVTEPTTLVLLRGIGAVVREEAP